MPDDDSTRIAPEHEPPKDEQPSAQELILEEFEAIADDDTRPLTGSLTLTPSTQEQLWQEFQAIERDTRAAQREEDAGDQPGDSDAGSYSGGTRPRGSTASTLEDTEDNEMASNAGDGGSAADMASNAYSLTGAARAGSRARGDSPNTPAAYTAGDQPGSMAGKTGNTGITGSDVAESVFDMLTGGPLGLVAGIEGLFGGDSHEPANLTQFAMPAEMQFSGTTTGGTSEDSFNASGQARGASPDATTDAGPTASSGPADAPPIDPGDFIASNAAAIATAVRDQLLMGHPLSDTIADLSA